MQVFADPDHPKAQGTPWWVPKFLEFKATLAPKLGGLPSDPIAAEALSETLLEFLDLSVQYTRNTPNRKAFIGTNYATFLENVEYIHKEEVINTVTEGVHLRTPPPRPPLKEAATGDMEVDFFTLLDILSGVAKGTVLGGFPYTGQTEVIVVAPDGSTVRVPICGVKLFRVYKAKNRGTRGITDFKENLLNEMYSQAERSVYLPTLQEIASTAKDITYAFLADFCNAYKQVMLAFTSWGSVTYLMFGRLFIELAMTFGWAPACRIFQHFAESFLVALATHFPYLLQGTNGERVQLPGIFTEVRGQVGLAVVFVDDFRFGCSGAREIAFDRALRLESTVQVLKTLLEIDLKFDSITQAHVFLGRFWDYVDKVTYLPPDKQRKHLDRIQQVLSGTRRGFNKTPLGPKLFTGRDLAELAGSLNYVASLERRIFPLITPVYRAADGLGLNHVIRIAFNSHGWLFHALRRCRDIVLENRRIPFSDAAQEFVCKEEIVYLFTDAAGQSTEMNSFRGVGGLSITHRFAFQLHRLDFVDILKSPRFADSASNIKCTIADEELFGQILSVWLFFELHPLAHDVHIALHVDNQVAEAQIRKGRTKYEVSSLVLATLHDILRAKKSIVTVHWISTDHMKDVGADYLSRYRCRRILGLAVQYITQDQLSKFFADMFPSQPKHRYGHPLSFRKLNQSNLPLGNRPGPNTCFSYSSLKSQVAVFLRR